MEQIVHPNSNNFKHMRDKDMMSACPDCKRISFFMNYFKEFGYIVNRKQVEEAYNQAFAAKSEKEASETGNILVIMARKQLVEAGVINSGD